MMTNMVSEGCHTKEKVKKKRFNKFDNQRIDFCKRLIARGYYDSDIAKQARESECFVRRTRDGQAVRPVRSMSTHAVTQYVRKARKQLKDGWTGDAEAEIRHGHVRMVEAFRMAAEDRDVKAMVAAQRAISDIFGLKRDGMSDRFDAALIAMQMKEMQQATNGTATGDSPEGGNNEVG